MFLLVMIVNLLLIMKNKTHFYHGEQNANRKESIQNCVHLYPMISEGHKMHLNLYEIIQNKQKS